MPSTTVETCCGAGELEIGGGSTLFVVLLRWCVWHVATTVRVLVGVCGIARRVLGHTRLCKGEGLACGEGGVEWLCPTKCDERKASVGNFVSE
jgi:hypothetical protein